MKNLKIRVTNEQESKEAQELLFETGFQWRGLKSPFDLFYPTSMDNYYIVITKGSKEIQIAGAFSGGLGAWKEITLPELRAMVVLKRNDVNDATHEDKDDPEFKYRLIDNHWYVITDGNPVWRKDSIDLNEAPLFIKPIEKTMKEYLVPQNAGGFMYKKAYESKSIPDSWIAIPEGAECLTKCKDHNGDEWLLFWKGDYKFCVGHDKEWFYFESGVSEYLNDWSGLAKVIWQSEQDEPFLTPETTLNDQYAEIEEVRQQTIESTLSQRQSQYGCYEDVAHVTQQILSALRIGNYDKLPAPMKESLHMIASKMARIVNGDPKYLDNWHDIGGYSKLIEKLIKGE